MGRTSAQSSFASDDDDPEVDVVPRDYYDEDDERYDLSPRPAGGMGRDDHRHRRFVGARGRIVVIPTRREEAVVDVNVVNDGDGGG